MLVLHLVYSKGIVGIGIAFHDNASYQFVYLHLIEKREIRIAAHGELCVADVVVNEMSHQAGRHPPLCVGMTLCRQSAEISCHCFAKGERLLLSVEL